jgi:uncharacterized protein (TIGR03437 family)
MKIRVIVAAMLFAFALQGDNTNPFNCTASVPTIPTLHSEGFNELVGDIALQCTGGPTTPLGQPVPPILITVQLNTAISSPFLSPSNSPLLNSYVTIDNPAPANIVFNPVPPGSALGYNGTILGNGTGLIFASGQTANSFNGAGVNANGALFAAPVDGISTGRTFRITNIRANATAVSGQGHLIGSVGVSVPAWNFTQTFPPMIVGAVQTGLSTSFTPAATSHAFPFNNSLNGQPPSLPSGPPETITFIGNYPGAFMQEGPGTTGLADFGTRLKATFNNIPNGVNLFVSTNPVQSSTKAIANSLSGIHAQASAAPQAQLVSTATAAGTTGYSQLPVSNGTASAVWEVQQVDPTVSTTFKFGAYVAFNSGGTIDTAPVAPTNIGVRLGYDSTPGGQSFIPPNPNTPPGIFFTLNSATGAIPTLSATVDARPCVLGTTYSDPNNACAPTQSPQVQVSSDSGVLTPSFSAATNSGISISGSFTGSTPVNGSLSVTSSGGNPGTSQQTLKFTAPGSGNSLQIPYNVTVLPANNPEIQPGGITDAFSFQGGSVAQGQIFALFGANFGPAALTFGTLDASGKLSTTVANTQVLFDGIAAPLIYVTKNQLSGVAPFELKGKTSTQVQIVSNGLTSPALSVPVSVASLSIASADGSGGNGGVIINQDGSFNSTQHPAAIGDTVVIYASYAGSFVNGVTGTDGRTTLSPPYPAPSGPLAVTMGGIQATNIPYFGNVPTLLESVMQVNVVVPPGLKSGPAPLTISANGITSVPWTTIAIK